MGSCWSAAILEVPGGLLWRSWLLVRSGRGRWLAEAIAPWLAENRPYGIGLDDKVVSFTVEYEEDTEGSPTYPVGKRDKVRITNNLSHEVTG